MSDGASSQSPEQPITRKNAVAANLAKHESQLATLRAKYNVPPSFIMRAPKMGEKVSEPDEDELGFLYDALAASCRFPLIWEIRELLFLYSLASSHLAPNGWRLALGFFALWRWLFAEQNPKPWREFMYCYWIAKTGEGMYHFQSRDKRGLFIGLPFNNKRWHEKFSFYFGRGLGISS